jgi:DNA-binding NarL/FixJ family response regulator
MDMGISVLIIAGAGPLRDGLHALVDTMPQISAVDVVSDMPSDSRGGVSLCPALVLLDAARADGQVWLAVRRAKARWPHARTIILVGTVEQQAEAEAAGADVVLLQGFPPGRLVAAIVKLVAQPVVCRHAG